MNPIDNIRALAVNLQDEAWNDGKSGVARASERTVAAFDALRAAIEQALGPGEPVAWQYKKEGGGVFVSDQCPADVEVWNDIEWVNPLYTTTPPQPKQEPVAVPEGWHIAKADNGQVLVSAPNCDPGSAWIKNQGPLPQRILYALVGAMLDAPQPQRKPLFGDLIAQHPGLSEELAEMQEPQPQREWVGLTDEDVRELDTSEFWDDHTPADFVRLVENKLREKNGGGV